MPFYMNSIININPNVSGIIDIALGACLIALIVVGMIFAKLSKKLVGMIAAVIVLIVVTMLLDLPLSLCLVVLIIAMGVSYVFLFMSKNEKNNLFFHQKRANKKDTNLTINETDELFTVLNKAVKDLSASKTGALITIERHDSLDPFMQTSGVKVNAPVSPELLETIFFNKTPLHDGASIIRGNIIASSAVFYQPTQKPLNGKYGSRHRAAIGISEVCDALTIVVSEETGKVSFAYKGELITVPVANFLDKLKEYYYM